MLFVSVVWGVNQSRAPMTAIHPSASAYFTTPAAMLVFALLELDGENRQRLLGAAPIHYRDAKAAKAWRAGIAAAIQEHPNASAALRELDAMHDEMTA